MTAPVFVGECMVFGVLLFVYMSMNMYNVCILEYRYVHVYITLRMPLTPGRAGCRTQPPPKDICPCIPKRPRDTNFLCDARHCLAHLAVVWVVPEVVMHGVDSMHHQADCHLVLLV